MLKYHTTLKGSLLFLLVLLICVGYFFGAEIKETLARINLYWFVIFCSLQSIILILSGLAFQVLSIPFQYRLKWIDWLGLSFIANFINQLIPYRPGMVIRYYYLNKNYQMPLKIYGWIMLIYFSLTCFIAGLYLLVGWTFGQLGTFDRTQLLQLLLLLGLFITLLLGMIYLRSKINLRPKQRLIDNKLQTLLTAVKQFSLHPKSIFLSSVVFATSFFLSSLLFYFSFIAMQYNVPFTDCLLITGTITLASVIPITPANIGINESLLGGLTQILYQDFSIGFIVALVFRISQLIPGILFGSLFSFYLVGNIIPWRVDKIDELS